MCAVVLAEYRCRAVCLAVRYIQVGCQLCQVDERHVVIFRRHVACLRHIVVGVVRCGNAVARRESSAVTYGEVVSEVVHAVAPDALPVRVEIFPADGAHHDRLHAHRLRLVDVFPDILLVCPGGRSAAVVCRGCCRGVALGGVVLFHHVSVGTAVFLVVVCKLDEEEVSRLHRVAASSDHSGPVGGFFVE